MLTYFCILQEVRCFCFFFIFLLILIIITIFKHVVYLKMSKSENKLVASLKNIAIDKEKVGDMDVDSILLSEEDELLEIKQKKPQPTNADIMKFLERMNRNIAVNNEFKVTATKRLDELDSKTQNNTDKIAHLEIKIAEMKSSSTISSMSDVWNEQRKLRNNINIISISPSSGENLTNIVLDLCIFLVCQLLLLTSNLYIVPDPI